MINEIKKLVRKEIDKSKKANIYREKIPVSDKSVKKIKVGKLSF